MAMFCSSGGFQRCWYTCKEMEIQRAIFNPFGSRKNNKFGRFISFVSVQGDKRSVTIIPEVALNSGWHDIALKIRRFINADRGAVMTNGARKIDPKFSYTESVKASKWQTKESNEVHITKGPNNKISISGGAVNDDEGLLGRCVVGSFDVGLAEKPTLTDIRRWSVSSWKNAFGIDVYEMGESRFLFQFPNKHMAEHILQGEWRWKQAKILLEWWSPTAGCCSFQKKREWTWIRAMGLPLHFWTEKIFRAIGDHCGGWLETEEETSLKNHLKWARIKIKGDGGDVPKEVTISDKGLDFTIPIWRESPTRVSAGEDEGRGFGSNQWAKEPYSDRGDSHSCTLDREGHMGTSITVPILNCISDLGNGVCGPENKARKNMGHGPAQQHLKKVKEQVENLGSFLFNEAQILLIAQNIMPSSNTLDPILVEIKANTSTPDISPISAE
ncbi:hypothetical protein A4A49_54874 [Nicotiana attenuata]|uniref:DUF4283 domain-containing protein n=1 Tax=Nicotiana attenuata TaxID=49451 RepID=A0A1J6J3J3_NICAT|nr:hypothetical protein A4A49_54874 [Nicotiana attenuata]